MAGYPQQHIQLLRAHKKTKNNKFRYLRNLMYNRPLKSLDVSELNKMCMCTCVIPTFVPVPFSDKLCFYAGKTLLEVWETALKPLPGSGTQLNIFF